MVLGIFAVIVSILAVAAWSVTQDELASTGVADGGTPIVVDVDSAHADKTGSGAPLGTRAGSNDLLAEFEARKAERLNSQSKVLIRPPAKAAEKIAKGGLGGSKSLDPYSNKPPTTGPKSSGTGRDLVAKAQDDRAGHRESLDGQGTTGGPLTLKANGKKPAPAPRLPAGTQQIVVKEDDTLWSLVSRNVAGDESTAKKVEYTAKLNNIEPSTMKAGQKLLLPLAVHKGAVPAVAKPTTQPAVKGKKTSGLKTGSPRLYTVIKGDSLSTIASRLLGKGSRYKEIFALNDDRLDDPADIKIGMTLRIPAE